ncbi:MAG: DUF1588 domain-containing protein [Nannocystaceae bacterium]|nr:DUF1588 domain-containing protein [Nannocystaceae bacterium]
MVIRTTTQTLFAGLIVLATACRDDDANKGDDGAATSAGADDGSTGGGSDGGGSTSEGEDPPPADTPLTPAQVLTRASLDLRGIRPTVDELAALEADPESLDDMIATFTDDPAFGERVRDLFAGAWRTRIDDYPPPGGDYDQGAPTSASNAAIADEVLNLVATVVMNDRPFTEILTGDETVVDPLLVGPWPLEAIADDGRWLPPGTTRARYTDGRPAAGVLSLNAVYWRHTSTVDNANRGRTNALSQALLCQSYLDRPIDFPTNLDLTDSESIRDAIHSNGACQACHSTLDPFASFLWGFMAPNQTPVPAYNPAGERDWQIYTDTAPGFFGVPGDRLEDLGQMIAQDERFISCTVRRVYEGLLGRDAVLEDEGALAEHREAFLASELSLKALVRSIVADPSYRGRSWEPQFGGTPEPVRRKVAPVEVLGRSLEALTGYAVRYDGREALALDAALRRLAGGSDRGNAQSVSTGAVLVQRRLAEAGAIALVESLAAGEPNDGRLAPVLAAADLDAEPSAATIVALIEHARSVSFDESAPEVGALITLWQEVASISSAREGWIAVVTAVLADPDHLLY